MFAAIPEYNEAWEDYELLIAEHIDHAEQILANHHHATRSMNRVSRG